MKIAKTSYYKPLETNYLGNSKVALHISQSCPLDIDQDMHNIVLFDNSRTACPTENFNATFEFHRQFVSGCLDYFSK